MNNKKKIITWLVSVLLILGIGLGIGVKKHMDNVEEKRQEQVKEIKEAEELIANNVAKKYEGIKKIEFTTVEINSNTGIYDFYFKINNSKEEFSYEYSNTKDFEEAIYDDVSIKKFFGKNNSNQNDTNIIYLTKLSGE